MLKYVLLGFLSYRSMTGYDLESFMAVSTSNFWHARLSQVYMTLKKLEQDGLVESEIEVQEGRPDRRVYTLTEAGRTDLLGWQKTPMLDFEPKKDALLVKVFFGRGAGKEAILTQLQVQLDLHKNQLAFYKNDVPQAMQEVLSGQPALKQDSLFWEIALRYGVMYEETYIRWLEEAIETVKKKMKG